MSPASAEAVALTGMMASGKSTVARALSRLLHRRVVSTDEEVVRRAGKPVARIFAEDGEEAFRAMEREVVLGLSGPVVVDLGGGAFCDREGSAHLLASATVIFLDVTAEEAARRLARRPPEERPLSGRWGALHAERLPLYQRAHHTVPVDGLGVEAVARQVAALVQAGEGAR